MKKVIFAVLAVLCCASAQAYSPSGTAESAKTKQAQAAEFVTTERKAATAQAQTLPQGPETFPAHTAEEILSKMDAAMDRGEAEGMSMTMAIKIPVIGSITSQVKMLGGKTRMDLSTLGKKMTVFTEGGTSWTYVPSNNTITIEALNDNSAASPADDSMHLMEDLTEGYDVTIANEDSDTWYLLCTRQKSNKDDDAPKKISLSVCKDSYILKEFSTSMKGVKMIMKDVIIGVNESEVTFNAENYPDAKVVDKRK